MAEGRVRLELVQTGALLSAIAATRGVKRTPADFFTFLKEGERGGGSEKSWEHLQGLLPKRQPKKQAKEPAPCTTDAPSSPSSAS